MQCEFDELTPNNPYSQVLKAALRRVMPLARRSEELSRKTSQLLGWMADVDDRPVQVSEVDALPVNRLTQRYSGAPLMAR
jgi:5-methylcytosine-specific restriction endonuclease McrBC regulatory subunit McrC